MYRVDCTAAPEETTDFAFDHLRDEIMNDELLTLDYEGQQVHIESDDRGLADDVQAVVEKFAMEKTRDLLRDTKNGYDTGFTVNELKLAQKTITTSIEVLEDE